MENEPDVFEDKIVIEEELKDNDTVYAAYADGKFIGRYGPGRARNQMVARQLAGVALSISTLDKDLLEITTWFSAMHSDYSCEIIVHRFHYHCQYKAISHLLIISEPANRPQIKEIIAEAFLALGWIIDPNGTARVDWFEVKDASEMSAHERLSAVERVEKALKSYRDQKEL